MVLFLERWAKTRHYQQQDPRVVRLVEMHKNHVPRHLQTAMVLLTVLPVAHWFTNEYIQSGIYNDAAWGFPLLVVIHPP
jgi:hypothetical protein